LVEREFVIGIWELVDWWSVLFSSISSKGSMFNKLKHQTNNTKRQTPNNKQQTTNNKQ
jgi:hypothetical protein